MRPALDVTPISVAVSATHRFVRSQLPTAVDARSSPRVLEVGCGDGALAARLTADGYNVIALDSSPDAVRAARAAHVDARAAAWPAFDLDPNEPPTVDAVLFTRSLHHLHPLGPALDRSIALLAPNGRVIVEDFAFAEVDRTTATWFHHELSGLVARRLIVRRPSEFATRLLDGGGDYELWHSDHGHEITPAREIHAGLAARFDVILDAREPYLYRYVCPLLPANDDGARVAAELYERERAAGAAGEIALIGRRFVAQRGP